MTLAARESGTGNPGPPVVLLHGVFGHAGNFGAVVRHLAPRRRVIALDLRNHGASPHVASMTYAQMADDVIATLRALGAWPAVPVGHSMGGKVAMALAERAGVGVPRLCVVDIAPRAYRSGFMAYVRAMRALNLEPGLSRAAADRALAEAVPEPGVRSFLLQNLRLDVDPPAWRLNLAAIAANMDSISGWPDGAAPAYRGPTLFLRGERSDYIRPEDEATIMTLFPSARIETIPGSGHWVHAEAPEAFLAALDRFLDAPAA